MIKREIQYSSKLTDREIRKEVNLWLAIEKDKARRFVISWPTTFRNPKFNGKWISAQEFSIKRNAIATINYHNPFKPNFNGKILERKDNSTPVTIVYRLSNIGLMVLLFFLAFISLISMQHEDTNWIEFIVGSTFVYGIIYLFYLLELNIARDFIIDRLKLTKRK